VARAAVDPDARPWVYAALEVSGGTTIGHLDGACKALVGERVFVPRRLQPDVDRDSWPCARCVSVEQLVAWDPDWPPRFPPEEILVPAEKTLESGPGVADTTGVGGCTPGNPHQEDTTMARSTSTYARKSAPIQTAVLARNGLCPTHRTPILSDGECWECGTIPAAALTAPKLAALKGSFALAIADGIEGAAALREAMLAAYRAGKLDDAAIDAALDMVITMREAQAGDTLHNDDQPAPAPVAPAAQTFTQGQIVTNAAGQIVRVYQSKTGNLYGKIRDEYGTWEYVAGALKGGRHLTADEAAAYGHAHDACVFCATPLSDDGPGKSVEVGYGPICAGKYGLPWG
jgi:hypothetical protein